MAGLSIYAAHVASVLPVFQQVIACKQLYNASRDGKVRDYANHSFLSNRLEAIVRFLPIVGSLYSAGWLLSRACQKIIHCASSIFKTPPKHSFAASNMISLSDYNKFLSSNSINSLCDLLEIPDDLISLDNGLKSYECPIDMTTTEEMVTIRVDNVEGKPTQAYNRKSIEQLTKSPLTKKDFTKGDLVPLVDVKGRMRARLKDIDEEMKRLQKISTNL